jgi:3-deoxy-D-manno-octulosonic-acid transferase
VAQNAAIQVPDAETLENAIAELLADEQRRAELGRNAAKVVRENLGAINRTVEMILEHLAKRQIYIVYDI